MSSNANCPECGQPVEYQGRGRPPSWHPECSSKEQRYYQKNRDAMLDKKREWYLTNREQILRIRARYREAVQEEALVQLYARTDPA